MMSAAVLTRRGMPRLPLHVPLLPSALASGSAAASLPQQQSRAAQSSAAWARATRTALSPGAPRRHGLNADHSLVTEARGQHCSSGDGSSSSSSSNNRLFSSLQRAAHRRLPRLAGVHCTRVAQRGAGRFLGDGGEAWGHSVAVCHTLHRRGLSTCGRARRSKEENLSLSLLSALGASVLVSGKEHGQFHAPSDPDSITLVNWSGTHQASTKRYFQPATVQELERVVADAHAAGLRLRAVGTALSPNGIGLSSEGMVCLADCSRILHVDKERMQVRVEAGARVDQVVEALRPFGLTMQVFASIASQQIGGYTQVGAHGTGALIPPVDEQVIALKLVTPALGTLELSDTQDPELFHMAKQGLGALGIVSEVTLQCVPAHRLVEQTSVMTREEVRAGHAERLRANRHVRYMWIPYVDAVVVVTCNPETPVDTASTTPAPATTLPIVSAAIVSEALEPMRQLLRAKNSTLGAENLSGLSFADLRTLILATGPLDLDNIKACNAAEAEFWRKSQGITKIDFSDRVLGFDCGGQQWVYEVAFPMGSMESPSGKDMDLMRSVLDIVETNSIAAPSPIEQRWTSASRSPMSVASSADGRDSLYGWVGIIMYLCSEDEQTRAEITNSFRKYTHLVQSSLSDPFAAQAHWAKLQVPVSDEDLQQLRTRIRQHFPVNRFNDLRRKLDPKNILSNTFIDALFETPRAEQEEGDVKQEISSPPPANSPASAEQRAQ